MYLVSYFVKNSHIWLLQISYYLPLNFMVTLYFKVSLKCTYYYNN